MANDPDEDPVMSSNPALEAELVRNVFDGLRSADLKPLSRLLRSDFELQDTLREALADAIDGTSGALRIEAQRARPGRPVDEEGLVDRAGLIAAFVEGRRTRPGEKEAAIVEAMQHFDIGRTAVHEAIARNRRFRERLSEKGQKVWDDLCAERAANPTDPAASIIEE